MMRDVNYPEIALGLLKKTKDGSAIWECDVLPKSFILHLPASSIILSYIVPKAEVERVVLRLCRKDLTQVGVWTVEEDLEHWGLVVELFSTVERQVLGWDMVLEDVEAFLQGSTVADNPAHSLQKGL